MGVVGGVVGEGRGGGGCGGREWEEDTVWLESRFFTQYPSSGSGPTSFSTYHITLGAGQDCH